MAATTLPNPIALVPVECCAPLAAPALSEDEAAATADLFKALADPARVRAIEPLGLSQPTVSHHMRKLLDAGLVEREQRGRWAYFSLRRDAVEKLAAVTSLA